MYENSIIFEEDCFYTVLHLLWLFCLAGIVMATFTAALQYCPMDSSLVGASICVSILAGWLFGTEGKSVLSAHLEFYISVCFTTLCWLWHNPSAVCLHHYREVIAAFVFLILIICTNYSAVCFTCHALHIYEPWLNKYHKTALWLLRVLVSITNGLLIYICIAHGYIVHVVHGR